MEAVGERTVQWTKVFLLKEKDHYHVEKGRPSVIGNLSHSVEFSSIFLFSFETSELYSIMLPVK